MLVLAFDSNIYNLDELKSMSPDELLDLAQTDKSTGGDTCEISTPDEFQELFNNGYVSPDCSYIFFIGK
jgi:hypothetical protein